MQPPYMYDYYDTVLEVDAVELWKSGFLDIPNLIEEFNASIKRIGDAWQGLKLGWVGHTATEAQDFNDRWSRVMNTLYGPDGAKYEDLGPGEGVLAKIAMAVQIAASNLGRAEDDVVQMFSDVTAGLNEGGGGTDDGKRNHTEGPVTQISDPGNP
jgi:hypothetical protein